MVKAKAFSSADGRAVLQWQFGWVTDRLSLTVDGVIAEERTFGYSEMKVPGALDAMTGDGLPVTLAGLGYMATCLMRAGGWLAIPELVDCRIELLSRRESDAGARGQEGA